MSITPTPKYASFSNLPIWAKEAILNYFSNDGENWVIEPIPALDGKTFLQLINSDNGEDEAKAFLKFAIGKFFPEEDLDW